MAILTNKYYDVFGTIDGEQEQLFGSFNRQDCKDELDAEREQWKDQGYKQLKIVSRITDDKPDLEVYKDEYLQDAIEVQQEAYDNTDLLNDEFIETISGIDYYHSGNEFDYIVAIYEDLEQAITTNFLEMDDFHPIATSQGDQISDYAIVNNNGLLMCLFECEGFHGSKLSNNAFYAALSPVTHKYTNEQVIELEQLLTEAIKSLHPTSKIKVRASILLNLKPNDWLLEQFKQSDCYQDMIADGMLYHAVYWLESNHQEQDKNAFLEALTGSIVK